VDYILSDFLTNAFGHPTPGTDVMILFSPKNGEKIGVLTQNKAK
jgi:hypothetical protein